MATNTGTCSGLTTTAVMQGLQALGFAESYMQNKSCEAYFKQAAANAVVKPCSEDPTRSDCICVINPRDPSCLGQTASLTGSSGFTDSSLRGSTDPVADPLAALNGLDPVGGSGGNQAGGGLPGAPGGGAGGPSLMGSKGLSPEDGGGNAPGPYNTNVISGTTSGGGGGNPYGRGGGSGDGDGEKSSLLSALANKFNLKKYLPGARNPASTMGASTDDIFKMVNRRYQVKTKEMTP